MVKTHPTTRASVAGVLTVTVEKLIRGSIIVAYGLCYRDGSDVAKRSGKDRNAQEHRCANEPKHPLTHNPPQTAVSPPDRFGNGYQEKQVLSMDRVLAVAPFRSASGSRTAVRSPFL